MKLDYEILWFEDDFDEDLVELIKIYIEKYGFEVKITPYEDKKDFHIDDVDLKKFDLLICDYHLSNHENTIDLIKNIQKKHIYFEVIFYSGFDDFDEILLKEGHNFQGIFYAKRSHLKNKILEVVEITLKKYLDINNLRGIVLAEVSYLENLMKKILKKYFEMESEDKIRVKSEILKIIAGRYKDNFKCIRKYQDIKIEIKETMEKYDKKFIELFDDKSWHINTDIKIELFDKIINDSKVFNKEHIRTELIKKRNDLSHGNVNETDFLDENFKIDVEKFKEIMQVIKEYKIKFLELEKLLTS